MSPKTPEQFEVIREERKQSIINTALNLFAKQGFDKTSISRIAKDAGISKGLIYNYFDSKEDLLKAVIWDAIRKMPDFFNNPPEEFVKPEKYLEEFIEAMKITAVEDYEFWKLYTEMSFHLLYKPDLMAELEEAFSFFLESFQKLFQALSPENPEMEMRKFGALLDGVFLHMIYYDDYPIDEVLDSIHEDYKAKIAKRED